MKKFGLIGKDIRHSGSPELFREAYGEAWPYDLLEGSSFETLWRKFLNEYDGVNITAPFKEDAWAQVAALAKDGLGSLSGPALRCGAINIAAKDPRTGSIHGDNSDFYAVIMCIAEVCFPGIVEEFRETFGRDYIIKIHQFFLAKAADSVFHKQPKALVAGCGGTGKAAAVAAAELGFSVMLSNRTIERAASFSMDVSQYSIAVCPAELLNHAVREADVIVYTASGVLDGLTSLKSEDFRSPKTGRPKIILESNYFNPSFSGELLSSALEAGVDYISGQSWLRAQALAGYPILTGTEPDSL